VRVALEIVELEQPEAQIRDQLEGPAQRHALGEDRGEHRSRRALAAGDILRASARFDQRAQVAPAHRGRHLDADHAEQGGRDIDHFDRRLDQRGRRAG
jgi:hypothetical protein